MLKKLKTLFKGKAFVVVFLLMMLFLPAALVKPAQGDITAIVTAVGIDKAKDLENEYTITLQVLTPQSSPKNNENLLVVSADGKSLVDGLAKLSFKLGKVIGFNHCNVLIVGDTLKDENILSLIDYFYRSGNMNLHTAIIATNEETKTILEQSAELNNTSNSSIQNNSNFNSNFFNSGRAVTMGTFFNQYYDKESLSLIQYVEKQPEETDPAKAEAGKGSAKPAPEESEAASTGGDSASDQQKKLINNEGKSAVFKKGKKVAVLEQEIVKGTNFFDSDSKLGIIRLKDVSGGIYDKAQIDVLIKDSSLKLNQKVDSEMLTLTLNLNFFAQIIEIKQPQNQERFINAGASYFTNEVKSAVQNKVKKLVADALDYAKLNNLDLFYAYTNFYKFKNKEFIAFLKTLPSEEEYLQKLNIVVNVKIQTID